MVNFRTGSNRIVVNALPDWMSDQAPQLAAEGATTEAQHRAAASYHFDVADKAKEVGNLNKFELHDSAGAEHLAAANRPKSWWNDGDSYQVELAHMADAKRLSEGARDASERARKFGDAKGRRRF